MQVYPEGFRSLLVWIKNQYNNVPVFITENGFSDYGDLNDIGRESYYHVIVNLLINMYIIDVKLIEY